MASGLQHVDTEINTQYIKRNTSKDMKKEKETKENKIKEKTKGLGKKVLGSYREILPTLFPFKKGDQVPRE